MKFSIIIVSWNNPKVLKLALDGIKRNSNYTHEVIVHLNEENKESIKLLQNYGINFTHSSTNIGLPAGANAASSLATSDWICLIDDDIYVLPDWDKELVQFHKENNLGDKFWLSSVMIEPEQGGSTVISPVNYGRTPDTFKEIKLLAEYKKYYKAIPNLNNIQSEPVVLTRKSWSDIKGFPIEFDKGIGSEEGLAKRLYNYGCRNFVIVNTSLVYHFQRVTTSRLSNYKDHANNREEQFKKLFGITTKEFGKDINRLQIWSRKDNV